MRARPLVLVGAAGLVMLGGCHTPSPAPAAATEPSASAAPVAATSASVAPSASASAPVGPRERATDGCWGPELPDSSEARLAALGARCVRGMTARPEGPQRLPLRDGAARLDVPAPAAGGGCVRAIVVGDGAVSGELVDASGAVLASDRGAGFALVDPQGPVCARAGQALTLRVAGQGEAVRAQVWTTSP